MAIGCKILSMHPVPFAAQLDWSSGVLQGEAVHRSRKTLGQMRGLFGAGAASELSDDTLLYSVEWVAPGAGVAPGAADQAGALLFGCTHLEPGRVGDEYFMTHGHFHALSSRAEYYLPVAGRGLLLRMTREGETWTEEMAPGKLLHIDGAHAHRAVNTGDEPLVFWACWPADAGYDYATIASRGFGLRVVERDGRAVVVDHSQ